jgi:pilus assembly protein FimV
MARELKSGPSGEKKLEQYGVWVKVEPQEVSTAAAADAGFELSDLDAPSTDRASAVATAEETLTPEEEQLLDELETELGPDESASPAAPAAASVEDLGLPELVTEDGGGAENGSSLLEENLLELPQEAFPAEDDAGVQEITLEDAGSSIEVPLSEETPPDEQFDDLRALEDELATVTATSAGVAAAAAKTDSSSILARIEEELRSIRGDLTVLKREITTLRTRVPAAAEGAPASAEASGFFDEDEDETIALTGDELDNILNTAEITEEPAEGAVMEPEAADEAEGVSPEPSIDLDILSYDAPAEQPPAPAPAAEHEAPPEDLLLEEESLPAAEPAPASELELEVLEIEESQPAEEPSEESLGDLELEPEESPAEAAPQSLGDLAMELEGLPEIEVPESSGAAPQAGLSAGEALDLEDLGEPSAAETAADELEALPEMDELEEAGESTQTAEAEELPAEIDLQALDAEAHDQGRVPPVDHPPDIALDELEILPEEESGAAEPEKEIEIDFEDTAQAAEPAPEEDVLEVEEMPLEEAAPAAPSASPAPAAGPAIPEDLREDIRTVLKYMDQLLEELPENKIQEFANSEYFVMYRKLFEDLGLGE